MNLFFSLIFEIEKRSGGHLLVSDNSNLYFFSTYTQSIAAIAGLSATFAIFYYQNLRHSLREKHEQIYEVFNGPYKVFLSEQEKIKFRDFIYSEQRALFVEPIYRSFLIDTKSVVVRENLKHNQNKIDEFYAWVMEFDELQNISQQMISIRASFLWATAFSGLLIIFGLIGIGTTEIEMIKDFRVPILVISIVLAVLYLILIFSLLRQAFQKPLTKI